MLGIGVSQLAIFYRFWRLKALFVYNQLNLADWLKILMASDPGKYQAFKANDENKIEEQFLKGTRDRELGVYCDMFSAKTAFEGQDGGVVTALLVNGFRENLFDAAIIARRMEGYSAEAAVAKNVDEVIAAKGTKYLRVNVSNKLRELINQGKKRIAVVCTPCEAKAIRKIQQSLKGVHQIIIIGLFCFEAFNKEKLKEEISRCLGIDIDVAEKTQVRKGQFIIWASGKRYDCKVKALDIAAEKACNFCDDFTSQFADISVGSVGGKEGYSTVIVRSRIGEEIVSKLKAAKEPVDKLEVVRLSQFKRERAKKAFTKLNEANKVAS